jgi:hypothetical protein
VICKELIWIVPYLEAPPIPDKQPDIPGGKLVIDKDIG